MQTSIQDSSPVLTRFVLIAMLGLASILSTGDAPLNGQEATIAVDVRVVNVLATVRDKHGQIVNTLNKDDFILQENGHPEVIGYFSRESDLPLTLGLMVEH